MTQGDLPDDLSGQETDFVRDFSRMAMIELAALVVEIGLLLYFLLGWDFNFQFYFWLCAGLLAKNLLAFALSWFYSQNLKEEKGVFSHLLNIPPWINLADRVSAAVSAGGMILLVLKISGLWPTDGTL